MVRNQPIQRTIHGRKLAGFRMLFTLEAKIASMNFGSLQNEFLGALPLGFEGVRRLASQKVKEIPLVDVQPSVTTRGKLLLRFFENSSALKCERVRAASRDVKQF